MSPSSNPKGPRIVAGVDGSPSSVAALRWAVQQARLTGGTVDAVLAWQVPLTITGYGWAPVPLDLEDAGYEGEAKQILENAIGQVTGPDDDPLVRSVVVHGPAAPALIDASAHADLLVVGCRGHGGFGDIMLGSVSQHCARHAHCPVVIIRGKLAATAA